MNQFEAQNKGSFGIRTKKLVVSSVTAKLCRRYFDDDAEGRRAHDQEQRAGAASASDKTFSLWNVAT